MVKRLRIFIIVTLLLFSYSNSTSQEIIPVIYKRARIHYSSHKDFIKLLQSDIATDHGIHKSKGYVESVFTEGEIEEAIKLGLKVDILIKDMQTYYVERDQNLVKSSQKSPVPCDDDTIDYQTPTNFNLGSMGGYLTYSEILQELDDMRTAYPSLISAKEPISTFTTEDGNPIHWVKISDNPDTDESEPEILYNSLHHAREPASMQQLIFYMWYLLENYAGDAEIKAIVDNTELYFIPVVNPDGYLYNESTNPSGGGLWRKNRRDNGNGTFGVDNNRNYDYHIGGNPTNGSWGGAGSSSNTNSEIYRGTSPFSEVENQAMKWFVEQHDFKIAVNNHTFGELVYFPFGYADVATPDEDTFYAITSHFTRQNEYNPIRGNPFSGDSDDYMYGTVGTHNKIFAMTPEIGDSFWPAQSEIIPICKEMMYTNLMAAQIANNYAIIYDTQPFFIEQEVGNFHYDIQRLGIAGSGNYTVSIVPISANITNIGSANQHNGLSLLEKRSGSISFTTNAGMFDELTYKLVINDGANITEKVITKIMGPSFLLIDDSADNLTNWSTSTWNTTTDEFVSQSSSITDSPSGNYGNSQNSIIELTNSIDLTNRIAAIEFFVKWDIEAGFDYVQFEVSKDNGSTWEPQCGKFTGTGSSLQGISGQPMYDGVQNEWVLEQIDLEAYINEIIKVRFQLVTDSGLTRDGFYFDDFKVLRDDLLSTSLFNKLDVKVFPNPVKDKLTVILPRALDTTIEIYSVTGQLIQNYSTSLITSELVVKSLTSGIYFIRLKNTEGSGMYKLIKE